MLQELRISGLGVIDDALLELHPGLNVLTGETGAGKTMVVSGLGLLLGARADTSLVRAGADAATVEGIVAIAVDHPAALRAAEAGAEVEDGLVLVRRVSAEGRSRAHVGGRSAPVSVLAELGELLVAVHGQADQWRLRHADQHRELLDRFGGPAVAARLDAYRTLFDEHREVTSELVRLVEAARDRAQQIETLQLGLQQIEQADPRPGEDVDLAAEDERLGHAETLREGARAARDALVGAEDETYSAAPGATVLGLVAQARAVLAAGTAHDQGLTVLDQRVAEIGYLAGDLAIDLGGYLADLDADPARLAWVQQRRSDLAALSRKYGETTADVLQWAKDAAARLDQLMRADDAVEVLSARAAVLADQLRTAADELSRVRRQSATELGTRVTAELGHLAMGQAAVGVEVTRRRGDDAEAWGRGGADDVEIQLAANPGAAARSVTRAASGGELSRVMLAIEVVSAAASAGEVPTFVFDEVDAGVGGRAALDIGARLAALAEHAQVVVVTHLAQVAAFADRHLVVSKASDGHVTASGVHLLDDEERLGELSRMMAGVDSATAQTHASELLAEARARRDGHRRALTSPGEGAGWCDTTTKDRRRA